MNQEPIGEIVPAFDDLICVSIPVMPPIGTKLYAAPPQREWVGLTDEEMPTLTTGTGPISLMPFIETKAFIRAIEAKLKEKNT